MMALALGCEIAPRSIFHRKNYFYPDLAKGYQISQYDIPLCTGGQLGDVRLHRIHLEEDAAKLVHLGESGRIHGSEASIVDYNRGGTPLAEIVTEPDIHSAEQARDWLNLLRVTLRQLGVSDVNMEEGSLRCDANVSVRPRGDDRARHQDRAQEHELVPLPDAGHQRGDRAPDRAARGRRAGRAGDAALRPGHRAASARCAPRRRRTTTATSRSPTSCRSCRRRRCSPTARAALPELPAARADALRARRGRCPTDTARLLAFEPPYGEFFEAAVGGDGAEPRALANWVTDLRARIGAETDPRESKVTPGALAKLVGLVQARTINAGAARQVLDRLVAEGGDPAEIVEREGLAAMEAGGELADIVAKVIAENPDVVERIRGGNPKAMGALVGPVMRETKGRADGGEVNRLIREQLGVVRGGDRPNRR